MYRAIQKNLISYHLFHTSTMTSSNSTSAADPSLVCYSYATKKEDRKSIELLQTSSNTCNNVNDDSGNVSNNNDDNADDVVKFKILKVSL
jgi:hypothetical protein